MCPLVQPLQKSQTFPQTSAVTDPRQSSGISTENTAEVLMVLCVYCCGSTACMFIHAGDVSLILYLELFPDYSVFELLFLLND